MSEHQPKPGYKNTKGITRLMREAATWRQENQHIVELYKSEGKAAIKAVLEREKRKGVKND